MGFIKRYRAFKASTRFFKIKLMVKNHQFFTIFGYGFWSKLALSTTSTLTVDDN